MHHRFLVWIGAFATAIIVAAALAPAVQAQTAPASSRNSPRTTWGDPDLQGVWTNTTTTPLERPKELSEKDVLTEAERAERNSARQAEVSFERPSQPNATGNRLDRNPYNEFWAERGALSNRTSLIVNPTDGRLPALTPDAQTKQTARAAARKISPADGPEDRSTFERCITRSLPGSMMPGFYNHNYQILQTPGYVVIHVEMIHDSRIIPLDGRAHVGQNIRQWLGDSRGRWEGNTLVVETTNLKPISDRNITVFGSAGEKGRVIERFTRVGANAIDYQVTLDDPSTFTKAWTAAIPMTKIEGPIYEYACHEGNYGMVGILEGHRAEEKAASGR
jgi:hypothetical protein